MYFRGFPLCTPVDKLVDTGDNSELSTGWPGVISGIMSTIPEKAGEWNEIPPQLKRVSRREFLPLGAAPFFPVLPEKGGWEKSHPPSTEYPIFAYLPK